MIDAPSPDLRTYGAGDRAALSQHIPSAFYMTGEDVLQISGWNITTGVRLTVSGRFLTLDGRVQSFAHDVALTTDRVIASVVRQIGEGWLLNLTVTTGGTASIFGATFARVQVVRGVAASGVVIGTLCSGYVTSVQPIAFPGGRVRSMGEGPGNIRSVTGTNPAAGVEISETVPTGAIWRLIAFAVLFVTDATVANRLPILVVDDGATAFYGADPPEAQAANGNATWAVGAGISRLTLTGGTRLWAFPNDIRLRAGSRIRTTTIALQAGDNFAAPQLLVEEWIEGQ